MYGIFIPFEIKNTLPLTASTDYVSLCHRVARKHTTLSFDTLILKIKQTTKCLWQQQKRQEQLNAQTHIHTTR